MKKAKRGFMGVVGIILAVLMAVPLPVFAQTAATGSGSIGSFSLVQGDVSLTRAGKVIKPTPRMPVQLGDVIQTGKGAKAQLTFDDESVVTIDQNTKFDLKQFAVEGGKRQARFGLAVGSMVANVKKYVGGGNTFEIQGPMAVAGVRGTLFAVVVMIAANGVPTMSVSVMSGLVSLASAAGAVTVAAGQIATVVGSALPSVSAAAGVGAATSATGAGAGTAGTGAAAGAGAAAGTGVAAGVGAGTIAAGVVAAAAVAAAVASSTSKSDTTTSHTTTTHH